MQDTFVSRASIIATALWVTAALWVGVVWLLAAFDVAESVQEAVLITGVLSIAIAVTWQIRLYLTRLSALVRVAIGFERPDAELHSIGDGCKRPN